MGRFFLEVSEAGFDFYANWRRGCKKGEWPWADNGCMYEVMLQLFGGQSYDGKCRVFRVKEFDEEAPEPFTGTGLMRCFNDEMDKLGMGCCGTEARGLDGFAFLTGLKDNFNAHPCDELEISSEAYYKDAERAQIQAHCFHDGMFMVHTKDVEQTYSETSLQRTLALTSRGGGRGNGEL